MGGCAGEESHAWEEGVGELTVAQDRLLLKAGQWKGALPQDFPAREGVEAIWDGLGDSLESCGLFSPSAPFLKELLCSFVTQADHSTMPISPHRGPSLPASHWDAQDGCWWARAAPTTSLGGPRLSHGQGQAGMLKVRTGPLGPAWSLAEGGSNSR